MQLPQWLARFNRHVTNPIQRIWAGYLPTFGILEHIGRKSGKTFRTPLTVFSTDDGVAILLTYGPNRDWLKNITAAGGGRMKRYGKTFAVTDPQMVTKEEAASHITGLGRLVFGRLPFEHAVMLHGE
ncbi:nitroreductase family deazaflavin-dependent oxidoreductase [Mycolicibacterium aubagnense]|uniref:Peptidase n=1 Tax=Mycolicibacterium aubagnense TaxID=319707 RepID=A0ABM7ICJ8_9MYCO|nr:nitroreductase family deazaflavin-dependent oxidoreductase [Mycolicibacterium aubagnense]TLH50928.1 nitroreductase family deazaflavin-dependent oxidoreductase [Mycolicibacterium aubagnense]WGI33740.1 nitroreductase family deazaflavin-dependent oxidoreductase [Mycolicibacterium aubagnense]BBX84502.1 peptidase [Mycolicibacterium aubagnense]